MKSFFYAAFSAIAMTCFAQQPLEKPDPIFLASVLIDKPADKIPDYCSFYNLPMNIDNDSTFTLIISDKESLTSDPGHGSEKPDIINRVDITTDKSFSRVEKDLVLCGFHKLDEDITLVEEDQIYEKGTLHHPMRTLCIIDKGDPTKLTFIKVRNRKSN